MAYAPAKFEVPMSNGLGEVCIYKKIHYLTFTLESRDTQCCPVPSTSCDLSTCKKFKLLRPTVLEEMYLQENTLIEL